MDWAVTPTKLPISWAVMASFFLKLANPSALKRMVLASVASSTLTGWGESLLSLLTKVSNAATRRLSAAISDRYWAEDFFRLGVSSFISFLAMRAISDFN